MPELALTMPKMSMTMTEGTVVAWLKQPGDTVREGEAVLEVATDKVDMEVESPYEGVLARIAAEEGEIVPVGEPLGWIDSAADDLLGGLLPGDASEAPSPEARAADSAPEPGQGQEQEERQPQEHAPAAAAGHGGIIPAVPAARRVAAELGIELADVTPGGPWGSIRLADVLAVAEAASGARAGGMPAGPDAPPTGPDPRGNAAPAGGGPLSGALPAAGPIAMNGRHAAESAPALGEAVPAGAHPVAPATAIPEIEAAISALQGLALRLGAQPESQQISAPRRGSGSGARSRAIADALPGSSRSVAGGVPRAPGTQVSGEHAPTDHDPRAAAAASGTAADDRPAGLAGAAGPASPAGYPEAAGRAGTPAAAASAHPGEHTGPAGPAQQDGTREERRRQRIRALLAQTLSASAAVPQFTVYADIDLEALDHARHEQLGGASWTAILLRAQAIALAQSPALTASWDERAERATPDEGIGIALAVDTPLGLLAPVVRDPHRRSLAEVAHEVRSLARAAQDGTLGADALAGGTTVFSNLGGFGVDRFNALITPPHASALSAGSVARRMRVFDDGSFAPRLQVTLGLTVDHRVADGADAARCMSVMRTILADPGALA